MPENLHAQYDLRIAVRAYHHWILEKWALMPSFPVEAFGVAGDSAGANLTLADDQLCAAESWIAPSPDAAYALSPIRQTYQRAASPTFKTEHRKRSDVTALARRPTQTATSTSCWRVMALIRRRSTHVRSGCQPDLSMTSAILPPDPSRNRPSQEEDALWPTCCVM